MAESPKALHTVASCHAALKECIRHGDWKQALTLLFSSRRQRVQPDIVSYNLVLQACRRASQWPCAVELLTHLPLSSDVVTVSTVVSALEETDHWAAALGLLREAHVEAIELNIVAFGAAVSCARRQWRWSSALLQEALDRGLEQSLIAHNNGLAACEPSTVLVSSASSAASRHWPKTLELLVQAVQAGLKLDAVAQNTVITAAGRGGRWSLALNALAQAVEAQTVGVRSFRAAIAAVACAGWECCLWLLSSMRRPSPDLECYSEAMFACVQSGLLSPDSSDRREKPPLPSWRCWDLGGLLEPFGGDVVSEAWP
eukprot:g14742.t1